MPNQFGGREDLDAIEFLKELNEVIYAREPGDHLGRRGVDRLARRLAADVPRRARVRLQVEHGLDARHARLLRAGPDLPPLPPPRADVQPDVRVHARTSSCRCRTTRSSTARARCTRRWPGRPLAEARQPARAVRATCGPTPARSCCSWGRSSPSRPSGATSARSTGTCSSSPSTPASSRWSATSTALYRDEPALWELDSDPAGFWWLEPNDADAT